jgi:hypothetical protein
VIRLRRLAAVTACAGLCASAGGRAWAQAALPAQTDDGACAVRVAAVVALDAMHRVQAVVLEPTIAGAGTVAGSLALFSAANRRYDLRFDAAPIASDAPRVIVVRFPTAVTLTGAYVAALDAPPPAGPCGIASPWSAGMPVDALAQAALAAADDATALPAGPGERDVPGCRNPTEPARTLREVPPEPTFFPADDARPHGTIVVRVTVAADGHALDAEVDRTDGTIADTAAGTALRATAVTAAMHSSYAPATFRCRPIIGSASYVVSYGSGR